MRFDACAGFPLHRSNEIDAVADSATAHSDLSCPLFAAWPHADTKSEQMGAANQNATFRDPDNTRGVEYCPCTIVLSFDSSWTSFDRWLGYRFTLEHPGNVRADRRGQGIGTALVKVLLPRAHLSGSTS